MKRFYFYSLTFTFLFLTFSLSSALGQALTPPPDGDEPPPQQRPNLLRELNLTPAQIQQMRQLNEERKPLMIESRRRLENANRALDAAIYADVEDEIEIQNRVKDVQTAQAEMIKNRTLMERAIRRILTPQQLAHFRQLRESFNQGGDLPNNRPQRLKNMRRNFPRRPGQQNPPNQN